MSSNHLTLEEYISYLRQFPYKGTPFHVSAGGQEADISYIEATTNPLRLELAQEHPWSLSGNNVDGFILTEWRNADAHETKLRLA